MSRLRWPDSTNSVSDVPGTIHSRVNAGDLFRSLTAPGIDVLLVKASFWLPIG